MGRRNYTDVGDAVCRAGTAGVLPADRDRSEPLGRAAGGQQCADRVPRTSGRQGRAMAHTTNNIVTQGSNNTSTELSRTHVLTPRAVLVRHAHNMPASATNTADGEGTRRRSCLICFGLARHDGVSGGGTFHPRKRSKNVETATPGRHQPRRARATAEHA